MFSYKKAKNVLALTAALSVLCSQSVFAATLELDLEETIQRALLTNPSVKIAESQRKEAKADYSAAKSARGISISLNHSTGRGGYADNTRYFTYDNLGDRIPQYDKSIGNSHSNSITASLPIFTGGELQGQIGQAKANYRSMLSAEEQAYNEMKETATTGYFNMLNATNMKALRQESVDRLQAHLDNVIAQYNVGIVARADVLRSEVELANAKQNYITASNEYDVAEATLNNIIGTPLGTTLLLKDRLQYEPYENDMAYCLAYSEQHRPELKQAEYGVDAAEAALVVARSGHMPKVYASASNSWASESWPGDDNEEWQVGVTASMNIFDSGVTWSKIHAAQEALVQAKESQRQIKDNVELEVRTDYLSMREAEKRITTAQVAVASAEEDYHIAVVRYQAGVGTNIDVMDAQEALTQAKTNYYQALYNYNTSKAALNTSMGVGVPVPEPRTFPEPVEDTAAQAADAQSAGTDAAAQTENAADGSAQAPANTADAEQPAAENAASTSTAAENGNTAAAEQTAE